MQDEKTGIYDFEGTTEIDTQCDLKDDEGREKLVCFDGHVWSARRIDDVQG
jgi:hypothetical protein